MAPPTYIPLQTSEASYAPRTETPWKVNRLFSQEGWQFAFLACAVPAGW